MKTNRIFLLVLLLLPFAINAQTNFSTVTYGTGTYQPQEIFFGDSAEVYNVGQCAIRGTTNGEIYWTGYCYTILNLFGGDAPARANCFVVGAHGVIRKNEACEIYGSWDDQTSGTTDSLFNVKFFNVDTGFVVGQNGKVLRTYNNGRNWTILPNGITQTLRRLIFTPDRTLYAVGDGGIAIKSSDNADTWTTLNTLTTERITDIDFVGNDTGFIVGSNGLFLKTTDAGVNWIPVASGVTTKLNGVDFLTPDTGFIVGDAGVVRKTTDGGASWTPFLFSSFNNNVADIKFRDSNNGYFAGQQDFYRTKDGGATWFDMAQDLQSVEFPTKDTGYAVGTNLMRKTTDGGLSWSATHPFNGATMYDAFFLNADTGYASGTRGSMYKTTNGGSTWTSQNTHCTALLRSVHFFNANDGIAVGTNWTIARTTNGGASWVTDSFPNASFYGYHDIFFATPSIGYLCGAQGKIYKTVNGGATFTPQTTGITEYLLKIYFLDTLKGFAIGEDGTLLKTINGGTTWTPANPANNSFLNAIAFYDSLNGYIAGESGIFFVTEDGGNTWTYKSLNTGNIYDITFYDGYHGYLVGDGDYRARYEPLKSLNAYGELCGNGGYNVVPLVANNIQLDTGNIFIMEMDTTGNDFADAVAFGATPSDTDGVTVLFRIPPDIHAGEYKVRLRATGAHPVNAGVPTTIKVYEAPVAAITISHDTLFTPYHTNYLYQWRKGFAQIPGANSNFLVVSQPDDYNVIVKFGCCTDGYATVHLNQCNGEWVSAPVVKPNYYVCDSSAATLTASGASQYHWYDNDTTTTVLSTDSFFVTPPVTATDTFYVAAVYGNCESDRMKILVSKTTKPAPPVVSSFNQCGDRDLFIFPQGSYSYNWYNDSLTPPFQTNTSFYHIAHPVTDTLYITTVNYDCVSDYVPVIINIDNGPSPGVITGNTTVEPAQSAAYYYTFSPGNTLQWIVNGGSYTVYSDSIVVTWDSAGTGLVQVLETNTNGCSSDTVSLFVNIIIVSSVVDKNDHNISVFPNPVSDQLTIAINNASYVHLKAKIYDSLGRLIKDGGLNNSVNVISLEGLPDGVYYLQISDDENILTGKLILKEE